MNIKYLIFSVTMIMVAPSAFAFSGFNCTTSSNKLIQVFVHDATHVQLRTFKGLDQTDYLGSLTQSTSSTAAFGSFVLYDPQYRTTSGTTLPIAIVIPQSFLKEQNYNQGYVGSIMYSANGQAPWLKADCTGPAD